MTKNRGPTMQQFLNSLLDFAKRNKVTQNYAPKFRSLNEFLNLMYFPMGIATGIVLSPCFVLGFHWTNPCKTSLILSFLLKECSGEIGDGLGTMEFLAFAIVKAGVFLANIWVWYFGINGHIFLVSTVHILGPMLMRDAIELFWKKFESGTNIQSNSEIYRKLQMFIVLLNSIQQNCFAVLLVSLLFIMSVCLGLLVKFSNEMSEEVSPIMMLTLGITVIDSMFGILVILGGMVEVFRTSKKKLVVTKVVIAQTNMSRFDRRWAKRFWRSCTIIKIKFGENNFFDELTPLRCLDFSLNLTVQVLLLSRG